MKKYWIIGLLFAFVVLTITFSLIVYDATNVDEYKTPTQPTEITYTPDPEPIEVEPIEEVQSSEYNPADYAHLPDVDSPEAENYTGPGYDEPPCPGCPVE
jgi:hypothetical protein